MRTIKASSEISDLFDSGKRFSNKYLILIASPVKHDFEHDQLGRVAFIAGKKNGNAVWRNSAKRRLREIYRHTFNLYEDIDLIFLAKKPILKDSYSKVLQECEKTIKNMVEVMGK